MINVVVHPTGPGSCRVAVAGDLDVETAPEVRAALHGALAGYGHVTVDLSALRFCDCAGLGALLSAARTARAHDADLALSAVPDFLARLLRLSHSCEAFTCREEALGDG
ncbi:STAS domain-containing protein [Streptomyces sp. NPDC003016]